MYENAYTNAMHRRSELIQALKDTQLKLEIQQTELDGVDLFLAQLQQFERSSDHLVMPDHLATPAKAIARNGRNPKRDVVADNAYEIIKAHGRPILRLELYELLQARGIVIQGKDPKMVLTTMLWRSRDKIVRCTDGYWLADVPFPKRELEEEASPDVQKV